MDTLIEFLNELDVHTLSQVCDDMKYSLVIEDGKIAAVLYE